MSDGERLRGPQLIDVEAAFRVGGHYPPQRDVCTRDAAAEERVVRHQPGAHVTDCQRRIH